MDIRSVVIVTLQSPRERIWGELLSLTPAGITIRGIELSSFDEMLRQIGIGESGPSSMSTIFYPIHRVERMTLDETVGEIPSLNRRFEQRVGMSLLEFLHHEQGF